MQSPKVSVIMPSLNVADYIRESVESVINQTLKEIEIICVDAGSTDGTREILQGYADKDERIKIIDADKKSYGYQMNLGIEAACGEYIGIVETDDWILSNMYATLYDVAQENEVDFVKADFYRFKVNPDGSLIKEYNQLAPSGYYYNRVLRPLDEITTFNFIMNTWSGIYSLSFLRKWNINHNETPGASYQDNGFWFMTFCRAERAYFLNTPFYMNRRDNPNSSVHSRAKVYCMNEEYHRIYDLITSDAELAQAVLPIYYKRKYDSYLFTYNRIDKQFKLGYIVRFNEEFKETFDEGLLNEKLFTKGGWKTLMLIIESPLIFYIDTSGDNVVSAYYEKKLNSILSSRSYKIGRAITWLPRKIRGGICCMKEHGLRYTLNRILYHLHIRG